MTEIRTATVDEMQALAGDMFAAHWDEIALNKRVMALRPDWPRYRAMEAAGMLLVLCAFDADQLVGYSVNFVMHHPHYAELLTCSNDLLFVDQAHRSSGIGLRLMRRTEEEARKKGAQLMLWHAKPETSLAAILPRMGYGVQDIIFSREI